MTSRKISRTLGVNIDHVATLRQARRGFEPSVLEAAMEAQRGGADGITAHLREDRRHIQDKDIWELKRQICVPLNLEMSIAQEILQVALKVRPGKACLVPEKRQEITTEGGLDLFRKQGQLQGTVRALLREKIEVSLFIDPDERQIREAVNLGASAIEIHTGAYANAKGKAKDRELRRIQRSAVLGSELGLRVHAGHGLNYENISPLLVIPEIREFNIGHSIISRSVFVGVRTAVKEMKKLIGMK